MASSSAKALEFLVFRLGDEEYGVEIQRVREIRDYDGVTRIANAPEHIKGVVNLRGLIVPIVDMRIRFGLGNQIDDQFTVVIVLNVGDRVVGIVVDSVSDVTTLPSDVIKPLPDLGGAVGARQVTGLGTIDERMIILVNIDQLLTSDGLPVTEAIPV